MKITVARKELAENLKFVNKACAVKSQMPILSGICLSAAESCLELQATDTTLGIIAKIPANVEETGVTVLVGKYFLEIISKLTGDTVTISTAENLAEITSEGTKYNLLKMDAEDFPKNRQEENLQTFTLPQRKLKNLIRRTYFSAAKDESRPIFTGVLLKNDGEKVTLAATNTHRLAVATEKFSETIDEFEFIVPAKVLQEISAMLGDGGEIKISYTGKTASFIFANYLVTARLIEGMYPPFERLLNEEKNIFATVEVAELKNALERVAIIAKESEYETVALQFADNELKISATSNDIGKAEEYVSAEIAGGEIEIAFNVNYWLDVLKVLDAEKIIIGLTKPLAPAEVKIVGDDSFQYIVTPVRRG